MKTQRDPEPSMDEILASIRQIISGDYQEDNKVVTDDNDEDILDLVNPLPEEESVDKIFTTKPITSFDEDDSFVSSSTFSETAQAFQELSKVAHKNTNILEDSLRHGSGDKTIEGLMREVLKPLLKEWIDANLPTIVRWVVNEQVERIVREMARENPSAVNQKSNF
jgi:uncharacterized protein